MRRFELVEGTSAKFWQVDQRDALMRVTFGRIGTAGQTQEKPFATAAAAAAETAKLIREKTKKGYRDVPVAQVAQAPVAQAPAQPKPRPAPAAVITGTIHWTPAALREVAPIRGSALVAPRPADPRALFARLSKAFADFAPRLERGAQRPGALRALMSAAREAFAGEAAAPLDVEAQAAAFALLGLPSGYGDDARTDLFVRFWVAQAGGAFALQALARAAGHHLFLDQSELALCETGTPSVVYPRVREPDTGWRGLRELAAHAPDPEYDALVAEARHLAPGTTPRLRALFAIGLERPELCDDADRRALLQEDYSPVPALLALAAPDFAAARAALSGLRQSHDLSRFLEYARYDLLARFGAEGATLLEAVLVKSPHAGADHVRKLAEPLSLVVSPQMAARFCDFLDAKDLRAIASAYLLAHPDLALEPLSRSGSPFARTLLKQLCPPEPPAEEAAVADLPGVLREPPWLTRQRGADPVVLHLDPLPFPETFEWKPGEEQERATAFPWFFHQRTDVANLVPNIRKWCRGERELGARGYETMHAVQLLRFTREQFCELDREVDLTKLSWASLHPLGPLVARHGLAAVDLALRVAEFDLPHAVEALQRLRAARVAPLMAGAFARVKKLRGIAAEWLLAFPDAACAGLLPQALGKPGKERDAAALALRHAARHNRRPALEEAARRYGAAAEAGLRSVLEHDALLDYPARLPRLPAFFTPAAFARPLLAGTRRALPVPALEALGTMLAFSPLTEPYAGLAEVREACDRRSLGELAWDLFGAWLAAGAPAKEAWAFQALAHIGDDECARRLTPMIRAWPTEGASARAATGLDILATIGTDVALMHLHGIAQKVKSRPLQEKARERIEHVGQERGLTGDELADRLVPHLGLDDDGSCTLDFGPRHFRVMFDETLRPSVSEDGKRLPDLPKPRQTDDPDASALATATWKALKKDARTIASAQVKRLEHAMCAERRWPAAVFDRFFVQHPLLVHLVRRLLWGVYDGARLTAAFRVAEDRTLAGADDAPFALPPDAQVGLVHRLHLADAAAAQWGQLFADYEVLQPFPQLARETAALSPAELAATSLDRVRGVKVPTGRVMGLEARGWQRGPVEDGGVAGVYEKPLPDGRIARLELDPGVYAGGAAVTPEQTLGPCGIYPRAMSWHESERLPLARLSALAISELVRDLDYLLR